ncbi:glutathione S-transferase family protein [Corallincola platygyrae]|uniref:Glutathione S-transferase family protein n=1 Tax=Corallincola platygyrae TaxID=1193278 RepID=A0ABW4XMR8_9GAMM
MGFLSDGQWHNKWYDTKASNGKFVRDTSRFRNWVTKDGSAGPSGDSGFRAESGRYRLYVSLACPWAHRTLLYRQLKGLTEHIDVVVVEPHMLSNGWEFAGAPDFGGHHIAGADREPGYGLHYLYQLYLKSDPQAHGRVTVPVLWDKQTETIVSNESSEIIRMLNSAFDEITGNTLDFYPEPLRNKIDETNAWVYDRINNGVYKTGFATTQAAYEEAFADLFDALDMVDEILGKQRYLVSSEGSGDQITEADWRLFTTLIRFDSVYVGHFKTNKRKIDEFKHIPGYLRELYQQPGVAETVNMEHIKQHYYFSHDTINPTRVVPLGPDVDYTTAHGRGNF